MAGLGVGGGEEQPGAYGGGSEAKVLTHPMRVPDGGVLVWGSRTPAQGTHGAQAGGPWGSAKGCSLPCGRPGSWGPEDRGAHDPSPAPGWRVGVGEGHPAPWPHMELQGLRCPQGGVHPHFHWDSLCDL